MAGGMALVVDMYDIFRTCGSTPDVQMSLLFLSFFVPDIESAGIELPGEVAPGLLGYSNAV